MYLAHANPAGMRSGLTKKPANNICGTNRMGIISCPNLASSTAHPSMTARAVPPMARVYRFKKNIPNPDWNPISQKEITAISMICNAVTDASIVKRERKYEITE